jgi:hypothetical protein
MQIISEKLLGVPNWAYCFRNRYCYKKICNILKRRDPWEVIPIWTNENIDLYLIARVSKIIMEVASWPNSLFLPFDEITVLAADYDGSFTDIHIWNELNSSVFKKQIYYEGQLISGNMLEFTRNICLPLCDNNNGY